MIRSHGEIIAAILANLEMSLSAARWRLSSIRSSEEEVDYAAGQTDAFQQAITLIKTKAGLPRCATFY